MSIYHPRPAHVIGNVPSNITIPGRSGLAPFPVKHPVSIGMGHPITISGAPVSSGGLGSKLVSSNSAAVFSRPSVGQTAVGLWNHKTNDPDLMRVNLHAQSVIAEIQKETINGRSALGPSPRLKLLQHELDGDLARLG